MSKWMILSGSCISAVLVGCQVAEPPPFDLRSLQARERSHAREVETGPKRPLPTTLESPFLPATPGSPVTTAPSALPATGPSLDSNVTLRLSLEEVIHRAVAHSIDVKVAAYQPAIDETRVTEAEARFDPTFFVNSQYQRIDKESGFGFARNNSWNLNSSTGLRQNLPSGGQAELRTELNWTDPRVYRDDTPLVLNDPRTTDPQFWETNLVLEITQPLLRDFGNEINRARITINRQNQQISLLDFRKQLEQTVSDVEKTYWQLVAAERNVKVSEDLLENTISTAKVLAQRMGQDVTRVQLSQANASIESRRAVLIRAKSNVLNLSDQLKRQMNDPSMPVSSGMLILPANAPAETPIRFDLKDQIDTALENRLELGQQQLRIDSAVTAMKVAKNNLMPQLNAVGSLGAQGSDFDFQDTADENAATRNLNYSIGLQFEIPLGNREARAIYRRAMLQRLQAIDQYAGLIDAVALDVKTALREVDTTWDEMVATRQARFAAADALLAINQREDSGEPRTPTFVQLKLDTQERLANAAATEVQATSNYNIALSQLEKAKGTLLRYNNIVMEEQDMPRGR